MAAESGSLEKPLAGTEEGAMLSRSRWERFRDRFTSPTRTTIYSLRLLVFLLIVGSWEILSGDPSTDRWAVLDEFYFANPSTIFAKLWGWAITEGLDGLFYTHIWTTFQEAIVGFVIGALAGVLTGLLLGVSRLASHIFTPFVMAAYSVPRLALAPILIVWFGLGMNSKIALVAIVVYFLVFFSTYGGVREIDRELVDVMRIMGAKRREIHVKVTIPSALTWVVSGFRISIPYALVAAVVGEFIASRAGLGFLIMSQTQMFSTSGLFAAILVVVIISMLLNGLVTLFEKRALRWKTMGRTGTPSIAV